MVSNNRLSEIAEEVFGLMDARNIFAQLAGEVKTISLEKRLQELLQTRNQYETIELAMYLRSSYVASRDCPSWQPLLNLAIEQGQMRQDNVHDIFYGLMPSASHPQTNVQR